jgi:drug/metabolite transporter (DMT)-like permease
MSSSADLPRHPPAWAFVVAFAVVYSAWGTTYLAIQEGVRTLPPGLFGGVRVACAGLVLLAFVAVRGRGVGLPRGELRWAALTGVVMFVGGNGLLTAAETTVPSGAAAVLVTTTPLWLGLIESLRPRGEPLGRLGWAGLALGSGGVLLLLWPRLEHPEALVADAGPLLVLGSALSWAVGSSLLRHRRPRGDHLTTAAYQMFLGGSTMALLGLCAGEASRLGPGSLTTTAIVSFFYLLVVGSLLGFLAYSWLLRHVSATLVGTHAYVNPLVALLVGAALAGETITARIVVGMAIIFAGVALVRADSRQRRVLLSEPLTPEGRQDQGQRLVFQEDSTR